MSKSEDEMYTGSRILTAWGVIEDVVGVFINNHHDEFWVTTDGRMIHDDDAALVFDGKLTFDDLVEALGEDAILYMVTGEGGN